MHPLEQYTLSVVMGAPIQAATHGGLVAPGLRRGRNVSVILLILLVLVIGVAAETLVTVTAAFADALQAWSTVNIREPT